MYLQFEPEFAITGVIATRIQDEMCPVPVTMVTIDIILHRIQMSLRSLVQGPISDFDAVTWCQIEIGIPIN